VGVVVTYTVPPRRESRRQGFAPGGGSGNALASGGSTIPPLEAHAALALLEDVVARAWS
jgi:hypothetical protein